jgi:1-pyrroline-5-carboxylate dehydrogenase
VLLGEDPTDEAFRTEYFGPILSVHVYDDDNSTSAFADTLRLVDEGSPYGLTGAVIAQDRAAIAEATTR